jgi:cysteine-rich repeat protein
MLLAAGSQACDGDAGPACGDRFLDYDETCDDGNTLTGDGCDATCQLECGNGSIDPGEECDDGNRVADDGCDSSCETECGNGVLDGNEDCDYTLTSGCTQECRWETSPPDGDADADSDGDADLPEPGDSVTLLGELSADSPTWHRPNRDCTELATNAEEFSYEGWAFRNGSGVAVTVTFDARAAGIGAGTLADGMLFLYAGAALPASALGCLASSDDDGEGLDPRIADHLIGPGEDVYLVVTAFADFTSERAHGTYELHVAAAE